MKYEHDKRIAKHGEESEEKYRDIAWVVGLHASMWDDIKGFWLTMSVLELLNQSTSWEN